MNEGISKPQTAQRPKPCFVKYMLAGTLNTAFWYLTFSIMIFIGVHYALASLLATAACGLFSFKTVGKIVFNSIDNRLIFKFISVYGLIYLINVLCLKLLLNYKMNIFIADAVQILPLSLLSFSLNRLYVFPRQ